MNPANDVAVVLRLLAAFERHDVAAAAQLVAEDFSVGTHLGGRLDKAGWLAAHDELDAALPDLHREILDVAIDGDGDVRVRAQASMTNDRPLDLPSLGVHKPHPTGLRLVATPHTDHFRLHDGQVVSYRSEQPPGSALRGLLDQIPDEEGTPREP